MIHKLQTLDVNSYVYFEAVKGWKKMLLSFADLGVRQN